MGKLNNYSNKFNKLQNPKVKKTGVQFPSTARVITCASEVEFRFYSDVTEIPVAALSLLFSPALRRDPAIFIFISPPFPPFLSPPPSPIPPAEAHMRFCSPAVLGFGHFAFQGFHFAMGVSMDNIRGLVLALSSSFFIGASFIIKKKGLKKAGATGVSAGLYA
ncbi:hypothetical protein ACLOJK_022518 [Asimina triloba]